MSFRRSKLNLAPISSTGGDCCFKSCQGDKCGKNGYTCLAGIDPLNTCEVADTDYLGDDFCDNDGNYNTQKCNWDNGDCCMDTCGRTHPATIRDYCELEEKAQVCRDSTSKHHDDTACAVSRPEYLADGACDTTERYNTPGCNWDGGARRSLTLIGDSFWLFPCFLVL